VVRSPSSQHRALRDYWKPEVGKSGQVQAAFTTGHDRDCQLILGLHNQADVSISEIAVRISE
jgi:hypothetical protein